MEDFATVKLKGQEFSGLLDFRAMSLIQHNMRKDYGTELNFSQIFVEIDKENLAVILETTIVAIQRVHTQIKREHIESRIGLRDTLTLHNFIMELVEKSLPNVEMQEETVEE